MTVSVIVPWRAGDPDRDLAWDWASERFHHFFLDWQIIEGRCSDGPFSRSGAIVDGASRADGDRLVIADADVWLNRPDALVVAVELLDEHPWVVPHLRIWRLSAVGSKNYMNGYALAGCARDDTDAQNYSPYPGNPTGTMVVMRRDVLEGVPPDVRFVGWGGEDQAWGAALSTLVGPPMRGDADLVHLWHQPQPRRNRIRGSEESWALWEQYEAATGDPVAMRELVEAGRSKETTT